MVFPKLLAFFLICFYHTTQLSCHAQKDNDEGAYFLRRNQRPHERLVDAHRRRHLSTNNDDGNDNDSFRIMVLGHLVPLFLCTTHNDCPSAADLQAEQDMIWQIVQSHCPQARWIQSHVKLANTLTILVPNSCLAQQQQQQTDSSGDDTGRMDAWMKHLQALPAIQRVTLSTDWYPANNFATSIEYIGAISTTVDYCLKGAGVRVAILDSGLDYTHEALSGNGTAEAYRQAYGSSRNDPANTVRGAYFPTARVVDGYDFLGDIAVDVSDPAIQPDEDPIDSFLGHGTGVAHALLGVAGDAELVALKVCLSGGGGCPDFAILSAMEYALDPNQDGNTNDHVDIINLSLGRPYTHPYYSTISKGIEDAFQLGVLTVVAAGNMGNHPGSILEAASTPNALAVGATGAAESPLEGGMAEFSSRGPAASSWIEVKPDLVAPGGGFDLAAAGTTIYHKALTGTSYAAPLVAGAAALVKQRCPECSPFSIKCILMNNARRTVRYSTVDASKLAPISWSGAGELRVDKAIAADVWAYNVMDLQPSISLGVLNVDQDILISKTIRVRLIDEGSGSGANQPLGMQASFEFRDPAVGNSDVLSVGFSSQTFTLDRVCDRHIDVIVTFLIRAANVPSNHMTSAGQAGTDPVISLDPNEVDGWVVLTTTTEAQVKDISLPVYSALRRAARVQAETTVLPEISSAVTERVLRMGLQNNGAGTAQIDTFELVHTSPDEREEPFGVDRPPADFRYIGYRTVDVGQTNCAVLVEFVFNTWEMVVSTVNAFFEAHIDRDGDGLVDVIISNRGPHQHRTNYTECRVFNVGSQGWSCVGLPPDHAGYTSNIVIRACSNDLGLDPSTSTTLQVRFVATSFGRSFATTDRVASYTPILFPNPSLAGPSFDLEPGSEWSDILVTGPGVTPAGQASQGLLLITNSYRNPQSTGAATRDTEAIAIARQGTTIYAEVTPDLLEYSTVVDLTGPICSRWTGPPETCNPFDNLAIESVPSFDEIFDLPPEIPGNNRPPVNVETCVESETPRHELSTRFPTGVPTVTPTIGPTVASTVATTVFPTLLPTGSSTAAPTFGPTQNIAETGVQPTRGPTRPPVPTPPGTLDEQDPDAAEGPSYPTTTTQRSSAYMRCRSYAETILWVGLPWLSVMIV